MARLDLADHAIHFRNLLGALNFPSLPGVAGRLFGAREDKATSVVLAQAYNDWHIDEWCGTHLGRFIPCSLPAIWDPQMLAAEVRRTAAKVSPAAGAVMPARVRSARSAAVLSAGWGIRMASSRNSP